jgi:hypothetical protein
VTGNIAASTLNQGLAALLLLYREVRCTRFFVIKRGFFPDFEDISK